MPPVPGGGPIAIVGLLQVYKRCGVLMFAVAAAVFWVHQRNNDALPTGATQRAP